MDASIWAQSDSQYLKQTDLNGEVRCVINYAQEELVGDDKKGVVYMKRPQLKPLVLNRTNANMLINLFGRDVSQWTDKEVILWVDPSVSYGGKITGGVRIRQVPGNVAPGVPYNPENPRHSGVYPPVTGNSELTQFQDSEIPF